MGLFSKPEVVIAKESSNAKEYLRQLRSWRKRHRRKREKIAKRDCRGESRHYR